MGLRTGPGSHCKGGFRAREGAARTHSDATALPGRIARLRAERSHKQELAAAIREGVRSKLDARQKAFDTMLARHPAAVAENARRAEARRLEAERLEEIARRQREREENRRRAGARHLVRRWHAKLAPAHAS